MRATHPALFLAACVFVALATGCPKDPDFIECRDDTSCDRFTGGRCLVNGETSNQFCAYPDESCPSGMRWSDRDVEDSISGMCVANIQDAGPDAPIDGPAVDAGPDAAPADASMAPVTSGQNADMVIGQNDLTLGAANAGGESASSLSGPVRVWSDGTRLWVGDNSNARALQWNTIPIVDRPVANVIVGQASATATTSATTQSSFRIGDIAPFAVGTKLIVADGTSNRVLIYDNIPSANGANASLVLGQASFTTSTGGKSASGMNGPSDVWSDGTVLLVVDNANSRVLIWTTFPTTNGEAADLVIGRAAFGVGLGDAPPDPPTASSMAFPTGVYYDGAQLYVADATNNRVLVWNGIPTANGEAADYVIGQADFVTKTANAGGANANATGLSRPHDMIVAGGALYITDSTNNRVVVHYPPPTTSGESADVVLGQDNLTSNGIAGTPAANRMNSPRGVTAAGNKLFVADYGWNRVIRFTTQ